jgi:PTH1 family peptidyl-tRNA hydrolase
MKCIIGLGNPGRKYADTRHNVGYMVLRELAGRFALRFTEAGFCEVARVTLPAAADADAGTARTAGEAPCAQEDVLLVRPLTYMNVSGQAVLEVSRDYPVAAQDILVIHDDLDLPFGKARIRRRGSSGGHKGIESIAAHLGTPEFARLRVGIGRPPEGVDPVDYVLEPFGKADAPALEEVIRLAAQAAVDVLTRGIEWAMREYNGRDGLDENGAR